MNILIASDSFKDCLSSLEAGEAMARGAQAAYPEASIRVMQLSDGGEGMSAAFAALSQAQWITTSVADPLGRPIQARYAMGPDQTAYIDMAAASGLTLLRSDERNPMLTSTLGTGQLLLDAIKHEARRVVLGLGGSATCDAGLGMLSTLGAVITDNQQHPVTPRGDTLERISHIDISKAQALWQGIQIVAACDVRNPLCGPQGAAEVFAPQKGASAEDVRRLDRGLLHLAQLIRRQTGTDYSLIPGAGAAGGTAFALAWSMHAHMQSGISLLLQQPAMQQALHQADLIVTGEGKMDSQSQMGKAPWGLLTAAKHLGKPIYAVAGRVDNRRATLQAGFADAISATPRIMPLNVALDPEVAAINISRATTLMLKRTL